MNNVTEPGHPSAAPVVTIGMPVYNGEAFIRRALDSLLAMTYQNFELVVSDNASTDSTYEICLEYAARDSRVVVNRNSYNLGAVANFRHVLDKAKGHYFMWAAADDFWSPSFLAALIQELEVNPDAGVAMCAINRIHEDGRPLDTIRFSGRDNPNELTYFGTLCRTLSPRKYNLFIYGLYRTELLRNAMTVFPDTLGGDRQFICQLALATRFRYVDEILHVRTHRAAHDAKYRAEAAKLTTLIKQLRIFCLMLVRSTIIPSRRKWSFLPAIGLYALFVIRQLPRRLIFLYSTGLVAVLLTGTVIASGESRWVALAAVCLLWTLLLSCYAVFRLRENLRAFQRKLHAMHSSISAQNHRSEKRIVNLMNQIALLEKSDFAIRGFRSDSITAFSDSGADFLQKSVDLEEIIKERQNPGALVKFQDELRESASIMRVFRAMEELLLLRRELRYLTDLSLSDSGGMPPKESGNPLADYARRRHIEMTKEILFTRRVQASRIRELYLQELFNGIERVSLPIGAINELTGHANKVDMLYVCAIARYIHARRIFEFGTYQGRTTYHLTMAVDEGAHVTTLNLPPDHDPRYGPYIGAYFKGTNREKFIRQVFADSKTLDVSSYKNLFDFVFVDADHSYEGVKNDTLKAFELIRQGGVIMWHDYAPKSEELVRFFEEFTQQRPLFRIRNTCLLLHVDGVDPASFQARPMARSLELEWLRSDPFLPENIYH